MQIHQGIKRLLLTQMFVLLLISGCLYFVSDYKTAYSAALGGMLCLIPTGVFALFAFRHKGAKAAPKIMKSFYLGEAVKILLSLVLFSLVFIFIKINAVAFFVTFIAMQLLLWMAPLLVKNK